MQTLTPGQLARLAEVTEPLALPTEHPRWGMFVGIVAMGLVDVASDDKCTTVVINELGRAVLRANAPTP